MPAHLWVGFLGMVLGAVAVGLRARGRTGRTRDLALVGLALPVSAGTWYLAMALGQATTSTSAGLVHWGRYADGVVTIPLLVLAFGLAVQIDSDGSEPDRGADSEVAAPRRRSVVAGMALGAWTMATTLSATLSTGVAKLAWLAVSVVGFAVVVWLVVQLTAGASVRVRRVRNAVLILWLLYPVVWLLGPEGFALGTGLPVVMAGVGLDLALKPGVGFLLAGLE